jgi:pancreatic lipase-related protein 2
VIVKLFDGGYESSRLHLVGFSFGSTVFGIAGREVNLQSNGAYTIERITGLDPGRVQSVFVNQTGTLNPGDAKFVETIHTEAIGFGDHDTRGHVQYFVNGGRRQPMCTSVINTIAQTCSHLFASTIWVESIQARTPIFPSLQCASWESFLENDCNLSAPVGNIGVLTSTALRGSYFLRTNNESPFSRPSPGP